MRKIKSIFFLIVLIFSFNSSYADNYNQARPEFFALMDPRDGDTDYKRFLSLSSVDGIAVRTSWDLLEPQDNRYDWSSIDKPLSIAAEKNKKVTLHIIASSYSSPPSWLKRQGVKFYNEINPFHAKRSVKEQAVPWDVTYIKKWEEFLQALASHLRTSGFDKTLSRISIAVPVPEMSLIACRNGRMSDSVIYSRDHYLWAWQYSVYAMNTAFPNIIKLVSAPVSEICMPDHDGARFYGDVLSYIRTLGSDKFQVYAADLNAKGSQRLNGLGSEYRHYPVGFQFIWSFSNDPRNRFDGKLSDAICSASKNYGANYFEVYKDDILNPDPTVQSALGLIHQPENCQ
ncbi:MAG: hypothetical protein A3B66_08235 [Alphaproteobacteria bacterium RIFCSPHIGHO2_02_FULL_46_13]|nr:MAG: hypothetical protein A3B66_08235 [Alphaproteobacteria bacterium RIFCSPHIGHO2_02_FULL_46_13]